MTIVRVLPAKDRAIASASYAGKGRETEYRIEGNPSLVLIVTQPGRAGQSSKVWRFYYSFSLNGRRTIRKKRLGKYPTTGLAKARRMAAELAEQIESGADPVSEDRTARAVQKACALTMTDLVRDYLGAQKHAGVKSVAEIERVLERDVLRHVGAQNPDSLTDVDVERLADIVATRGAPSAARRLLTHLRGVFNFALIASPAVREKYRLRHNPCETVGRSRRGVVGKYGRPGVRHRVLSDNEIIALWSAIAHSKLPAQTGDILKLLLLTGQRRSEVCQARRSELDLDARVAVWTIPAARTKNGREQVVPLPPLAVAAFRRALQQHSAPVVFPGSGLDGAVAPHSITTGLRRLVKAGTVTPDADRSAFTPHDLRRTVETGLARLRVTKEVRDAVLNHKDGSVGAAVYNKHNYMDEKLEALGQWEAHIVGLVGVGGGDDGDSSTPPSLALLVRAM